MTSSGGKAGLRRVLRARQREMASGECELGSRQACARLQERPEWQESAGVLAYASMPGEIDLWPVLEGALEGGKVVCLPRYDRVGGRYEAARILVPGRDLVRGQYGILEPSPGCERLALNRLDLILVPGLGFDLRGRRLGRGKGYYDQLLPLTAGLLCGVGFDWQVVEEIPTEPHDHLVDCILTPVRWIRCGQRPG